MQGKASQNRRTKYYNKNDTGERMPIRTHLVGASI
jgi:hypothetical protein